MWCDKDFTLHNNFCYRYYGAEMRKPYHYAQKLCLRSQSSLLSLHSAQEESFVATLAGDHSEFWISLNDEDGPADTHREGYFKWGWEEVEFNVANDSYCHWKPGQPKNKHHLDCVKVDMQGWAMAPGGCAAAKLPVICKKKGMFSCRHSNLLTNNETDVIHSYNRHFCGWYSNMTLIPLQRVQ